MEGSSEVSIHQRLTRMVSPTKWVGPFEKGQSSATRGDGEAVFFHHGAELVAEPVGGEAEFPERVVMGAFVLEGLPGGAGDGAGGFRTEGNAEVAVDRAHGVGWFGDEIAVEDAQIAVAIGPAVLFLEVTEPGGGQFRVLEGGLAFFGQARVDPFPNRIKDADVGGDGFRRVAENVDDAGIGEFLSKTVHRSGQLGGLGEQDFVFSVEVEVSLEAGAVVAHDAPALRGGQIVGKAGAPEQADVGEEEVDGLSDKGVDKKAVVLLRLGEAHLVHVVPAAEKAALDPGDEQAEEAVASGAEAGDAEDDFLDRDAGKNGLIHEDRGKDLPVPGEQFLEEGGAAAGRGDDEDRPANLLASEPREKDVVQGSANRDHDPESGEQQQKKGGDQPAAGAERLAEVGVEESLGS